MPRRKKTDKIIGKTSADTMRNALRDIENSGLSVKAAAIRYEIPRTTLRRYVDKIKDRREKIDWNSPVLPRLEPNYKVNQIFSQEEEENLSDYFQTMAKLHHGLNPRCARKLTYDLALANRKRIPPSWAENETAGRLWFNAFLKRRGELSLRSAEATSLGRAMGFNKPVVQRFFINVQEIYEKYKLGPHQVYNVDETGLTTVQGSGKVIARKGQKQVGQITSSERGTLVTMVGCINAIGNNIPPLLIFPRKNYKDFMIKNAPPGTVGVASSSGWITSELFVQWFQHFIRHAKPTSEAPVLLIMDNHEAHISLQIIKLAKENHVILLTLPPHTSHKLQPLDKTVYYALKKYYNQHCQAWLLINPGKRVTIYDIADILGEAYPLAFTARNCTSGFRSTGIFPFNPNVFNDDDFIASTVTDIQIKHKDGSNEDNLNQTIIDNEKVMIDMPSSSARDENSINDKLIVLPTDLKPFPKATASDENKKFQRKKKKSEILTDTPVLERLEEEEKLKEARKSSLNKNLGAKRSLGDSLNLKPCTKPQKKRKLPESSSSDDESIEHLTDSEDIDIFAQSDEEDNHPMNDLSTITEGSFVLVKFPTKKTVKYYVGRILTKLNDEEFDITFFRRHGSNFISPNVPDISTVLAHDIVLHLMQPEKVGGTSRTANLFSFPVDLSSYNVN